jgi:Tat protein secretion system quality control protein TatD with DNase activity
MGFKGCREGFSGPSRKFPNVPSSLKLILIELAGILKVSPESLAEITTKNAERFFGL